MTDLFAARSQMAMSLAFHILFAVAGMGMPLMMVIAEAMALRTGDDGWRVLARRWAKGTAILFAVGAVSGTVLSLELGLLWPEFMARAGPVIGLPFSMEGFAFFLEAIFLGLYLYGWERLSPGLHLASGVIVALSGVASGAFVVTANAWMNTPAGFDVAADGSFVNIRPWEAMFNPAAFNQMAHMTLAAFVAVGFAVAAIHAWALLRDPHSAFHQKALSIALGLCCVATPLQMVSGHASAQHIAEHQPVKLAAAEALWETTTRAPMILGGLPDEEAEVTRYGVEIPGLLSFLAFNDPDAEVMGLKDVPPELRPPVTPTHIAYQAMVGMGTAMMLVALTTLALAWRQRGLPTHPLYLKTLIAAGPLGLLAIEAGWVVTEVGRQPWVIRGHLMTAEAVTPMPHLTVPFVAFTALYLVLGVVVIALLRRQVFMSPGLAEEARHD